MFGNVSHDKVAAHAHVEAEPLVVLELGIRVVIFHADRLRKLLHFLLVSLLLCLFIFLFLLLLAWVHKCIAITVPQLSRRSLPLLVCSSRTHLSIHILVVKQALLLSLASCFALDDSLP